MTRGRQRLKKRQQAIALAKKEAAAPFARKQSNLGDSPADIPLIGQAVRGGWGINDGVRLHVAKKMLGHVDNPDPKVSIAAGQVVLKMNEQQEKYLAETPDVNDDGPKPSEVIPEVLKHADILSALRSAALASDSLASPVRAEGQPGTVEAGKPSGDLGQGDH